MSRECPSAGSIQKAELESWIMKLFTYGLLRIGLFIIAFLAVLYLAQNIWFAAAVGLVVSFGVGYLLTPRLRESAGQEMSRVMGRRKKKSRQSKTAALDADAEDAYTDGRFMETESVENFNNSNSETNR